MGLAIKRMVAATTQAQALNVLVFFFAGITKRVTSHTMRPAFATLVHP